MKQKINKYIGLPLKYAIKHWKYDWGNLIIIIFPVLITFPLIRDLVDYTWYTPILFAVIVIIGWIQTNYRKDSIIDLKREYYRMENERDHLRQDKESIPYEIIKEMYKHWNLGYDDRITIYRYELEHFVPVSRYSLNRELKKRGRDKYPKNQGFISKCWHKGHYHIENLPDYLTDEKGYLDQVSKLSNMNKGDLRNISMRSRSYYCKNLINKTDLPIAIIVIESRNKKLPINVDRLNEDLDGFHGDVLVSTIEVNLPLGRGDD